MSYQAAPPLFKQPPRKRQKLSNSEEHAHSSGNQDHRRLTNPGSSAHRPRTHSKPPSFSEDSSEWLESAMDQSEEASDPAQSAAARGTPGSTSSWRAGPQCPHNTPPLLYPGATGQLRDTPVPVDALPCQPELNSVSKASSNAITPSLVQTGSKAPQAQQTQPPQDPPTNPSTEEGHSVIATVVGPSEFEPSDSIKRQLLAAAGGALDAASLEGLVRPLFASPPATEQQDLQSLLLAAAQQQQQNQETRTEQTAALHSRRTSSDPAAAGHAEHYMPALKVQTNPIAKPFAVPCNVNMKAGTAEGTSQQPPTSVQSNPHPDQSELYKAAAAHMAVMLQIPFSGSLGPWQPPPLKLDSPPLSVLELHPAPVSRPPSAPLGTLSSVSSLTQQPPAQLLPPNVQSTLSMLTNPATMQKMLEQTCQADAGFDLEALMKAVKVEATDLYAAAKALESNRSSKGLLLIAKHEAVSSAMRTTLLTVQRFAYSACLHLWSPTVH